MDHWGDPWADNNADEQKLPTKIEVTSPPPIAHTSAPVLLNGFLDDAGWGNEDASFGDWATPPGIDDSSTTAAETRVIDPSPVSDDGGIDDGPRWGIEETRDEPVPDEQEAWGKQEDVVQDAADIVTSDTSDTSTTVQDPEDNTATSSNHLNPEDDSSARPSTSPSETSRFEAPVESPRTSIEDEHGSGKTLQVEESVEEHDEEPGAEGVHGVVESKASDSERSVEEEFGTFTEDTPSIEASSGKEEAVQDDVVALPATEEQPDVRTASPADSSPTTAASTVPTDTYTVDPALLDELFPPPRDGKDLDEAPDDPIYSTSGRKAWYRLTRKQTLREFNGGGNGVEDNYIRVRWASSQIRSEVNKVVGRWAREDRLSGTGPGARASFYWDTPAPADPKVASGHSRTKTTVLTPRAAATAPVSARQSLPPPSKNTPAAFNWSSPTEAIYPWKLDSPFTSSPLAQSFTSTDNIQAEESREVSLDVARIAEQTGKQTLAPATETPTVAHEIIQPVTLQPTIPSEPWTNHSTPNTHAAVQEQPVNVSIDDDDEWGEMISSPTVFSPTTTYDNNLSAFSSAPQTPPNQDQSTEKMHIVRLRSTISPTSALFERKSFVPLHAEEGPIGPGILKARQRQEPSALEKAKSEVSPPPPVEIIQQSKAQQEGSLVGQSNNAVTAKTSATPEPSVNKFDDDDFSAFTSNTVEPNPTNPSTPPPPAPPAEPTVDSWADADFSIFESSAPPPNSSPPRPKRASDASDPITSTFGTPPRPSSAASSSTRTFTRSSPPRNVTPPSVQPLTGATNAAQRRKIEEEGVLRDIIKGLPDLRYMLI